MVCDFKQTGHGQLAGIIMEKRKKAFEDAAKKRQGNVERPAVSKRMPKSVEYTNTKVVQPNRQALQKNGVILDDQQDFFSDVYRMLRTKVLQSMRQNNWNTLGITSSLPNEGKTITTINLAISLAKELNQTVLLVDFDLRRPTIHRYFGLNNDIGLSDYISGQADIEEVFINPGVERLVLLPGREPIHNSSETLSSPQFFALIEEMKTRYADRVILFDLPPLLLADDALTMAPFIDAFLLVVEDGVTDEDDLRNAQKMLADANIIGSVLNKAEDLPKNYYQYYV